MGFQALLQRPNGEAWDISELVVSAEVTDRINPVCLLYTSIKRK